MDRRSWWKRGNVQQYLQCFSFCIPCIPSGPRNLGPTAVDEDSAAQSDASEILSGQQDEQLLAMSDSSVSWQQIAPSEEWEMVIIGINGGLDESDPVNYPVEDALVVATTAQRLHLFQDPLLLTDKEVECGKDSLRNTIEIAAERLKKSNKKNLLVYYGGHGFRDQKSLTVILPKGREHPEELLILEKMVVDTLAENDCHAINVLVISAACGDYVLDESEEIDRAYIDELGGPPWLDPRGNKFVLRSQNAVYLFVTFSGCFVFIF